MKASHAEGPLKTARQAPAQWPEQPGSSLCAIGAKPEIPGCVHRHPVLLATLSY